MKTNEICKGLEKTKEIEPNGSFPNEIVSKWHPDEDRVVEIKQE
jgi:hypothetical protein